jgi:hypothetical protein
METFGFGQFSPGINFMLMPVYFDVLKIQAIEFNDQIRKSAYTFEMQNNQLRIFPIPTFDRKLWFTYVKKSQKSSLVRSFNYNNTNGEPTTEISLTFKFSHPETYLNELNDEVIYTADNFKFKGYQLKANPSWIKQTVIQLPLLCFPREKSITGPMIERSVMERIKYIETLEKVGAIVIFQDLNNGEEYQAIIERTQFVTETIPDNEWSKKEKGGILIVTLRLIQDNVYYSFDGSDDWQPNLPDEES